MHRSLFRFHDECSSLDFDLETLAQHLCQHSAPVAVRHADSKGIRGRLSLIVRVPEIPVQFYHMI